MLAHPHHGTAVAALAGRRLGLSGHAAFETYSVLTRMPAPARGSPVAISRLLAEIFPATRFLSDAATAALLSNLPATGVAGGAVYDALVGATAVEHGLALATRDRRALDTYRALGVQIEIIGEDRAGSG